MNNNYLEKLEFNKIKEILSTSSFMFVGNKLAQYSFPIYVQENVDNISFILLNSNFSK